MSGDKAGVERQQGELDIESRNPGWSSFNVSFLESGSALKEAWLALKFRPLSFIFFIHQIFMEHHDVTDTITDT